MNKKQKKMLKRIIVASILFIIIKVAKLPEYIENRIDYDYCVIIGIDYEKNE